MTSFNPPHELSDPVYHPGNVQLFQKLYGEHLISLGAYESIEQMFLGVKIKRLKALDVGFGLGGVAFYLAEKYHMQISGVECHPWMVDYATRHAHKAIAHQLEFKTYLEEGQIPYPLESFDLVYSKGVFNHIQDKPPLLCQLHARLKTKGRLVMHDWIVANKVDTSSEGIFNETQSSYEHILHQAGFKQIEFRNDSQPYLEYIQGLLRRLEHAKTHIETQYGSPLYQMIKTQHQQLVQDINRQEKWAARILAVK